MRSTSSGLEQPWVAMGEPLPGRAEGPESAHGGRGDRVCCHNRCHHPALNVPGEGELGAPNLKEQ